MSYRFPILYLVLVSALFGGRPIAPFIAEARGHSMQPAIRDGDRFKVLAYPFERVRRGMVVLRWDEAHETLISHRVIAAGTAANGKRYLVTKGDNNREPDFVRVAEYDYVGLADLPIK